MISLWTSSSNCCWRQPLSSAGHWLVPSADTVCVKWQCCCCLTISATQQSVMCPKCWASTRGPIGSMLLPKHTNRLLPFLRENSRSLGFFSSHTELLFNLFWTVLPFSFFYYKSEQTQFDWSKSNRHFRHHSIRWASSLSFWVHLYLYPSSC